MHPELDLATIVVRPGAHPIVRGLADFTVVDERYSYLHTNPDITVMCEHYTAGRLHPIVWARESESRGWSTTVSATTRSYESAGHVKLLRRTVDGSCETSNVHIHWLGSSIIVIETPRARNPTL